MNHQEAVQSNATEKYLLGELPSDLCDQFEEHFFDCRECAENVRAMAALLGAGRIYFEENAKSGKRVPSRRVFPTNWFGWLRPAIAAPAIVVLAAVVIFQSSGLIPSLRDGAGKQHIGQIYESSYRLTGRTRGENVSKIAVRPSTTFALDFDFTPAKLFRRYEGELTGPSGGSVLTFEISENEINKQLYLVVPGAGLQPGSYEIIIYGRDKKGSDQKAEEVLRLSFIVEFRTS